MIRALRCRHVAGLLTAVAIAVSVAACGGGGALALPDSVPDGVTGVLFVDRDHDGKHSGDEPALAGWQVGLYGTSPVALVETTTDDEGRFAFAGVDGLAGDDATLKFAPHLDAPGAFDVSRSQVHQRLNVQLGDSVAVAVRDFTLCERLDGCAVDLPDLVPILELSDTPVPEYPGTAEWYLDTTEKPGRVLMRFASMTSNIGDGLLHVVALEPPSNAETQPTQQRLYGESSVYVRPAGSFIFHPEHDHFHLDRFETYELRPAGQPEVVASGTKASFCLTDIAIVPDRPEVPPPALTLDLPPMTCGTREQGISPGFTDYYGPALAGQWIDVTDVPSGAYDLVLTSDPDNILVEADETNNTISLPLQYTNPLD